MPFARCIGFIDIYKLFHRTHGLSILQPFNLAAWIPIPNIYHHILRLTQHLTFTINTHLIINAMTCGFIMPFQLIPIHIHHQITIRRSTTINLTLPPGTTGGTNIVFQKLSIHNIVLEIMSMTSQDMYLIILQSIGQLLGISNVTITLNAIPNSSMHIEENQRTLRYKTQITLQPV